MLQGEIYKKCEIMNVVVFLDSLSINTYNSISNFTIKYNYLLKVDCAHIRS